jgi:type I restriction enzyme S subunit
MSEDASEQMSLDEITDECEDGNEEEMEHPRYGKLPASWRVKEISDTADVVGGSTPSTDEDEYWNGDIPWATPTDITELSGNEISETNDNITEEGLESASTHLLPPYSVLMTSRASIGKCAVNTVEMATNQGFKSLNPNQNVQPWYLYYRMLKTAPFLKSLGAGSTFDEVSKSVVSSVDIPVPPIEEQRKIANVLYTVDEVIQRTDEIINQRERVKRGLMQDIFRYGVGPDGIGRNGKGEKLYRETKYGLAPKEWDIVPLNSIVPDDAPVTYGIVKPGEHHPGGVPVIKVEDITHGEIQQGDLLHTDPEIHEKYDRAELEQGDLLFTIRGTVGRMAFVPESLEGANITQDTARIRVEEADPRFVRYYLETATPNNYFKRHTKGQAVQGINLEDLREVPVHLPSENEQKRIVEILNNHSEQIQTEREYLEHLKRVKQGLMQDLLSGEVRTHNRDIDLLPEVEKHG